MIKVKFNGWSKIELEMMKDEFNKALPGIIAIVPSFAEVVKKNYDELIKQGFDNKQAMYMAVQSTSKQMGFN